MHIKYKNLQCLIYARLLLVKQANITRVYLSKLNADVYTNLDFQEKLKKYNA